MVSVIIPALNEAAIIEQALAALDAQPGDHEVIVVDGGSSDGTPEAVEKSAAILVRKPGHMAPGIGNQINLGAARARGDVLLFLHCDVTLPPGAYGHIHTALADRAVIGGGFVPKFVGPAPTSERLVLGAVERIWQARTRAFRWFAGDTGPFIRTDIFRRSGGYPTTSFASDWDFAARLRSLGPLAVISAPVAVDSRRHVHNGVLKTLAVTGSVELMYRLGAEREFLRGWYRRWLPRERAEAGRPADG